MREPKSRDVESDGHCNRHRQMFAMLLRLQCTRCNLDSQISTTSTCSVSPSLSFSFPLSISLSSISISSSSSLYPPSSSASRLFLSLFLTLRFYAGPPLSLSHFFPFLIFVLSLVVYVEERNEGKNAWIAVYTTHAQKKRVK